MNLALLHSDAQKFIRNYSEDITILAFKGSPFENISVQELMEQIEGFRKTKKKLPTWHQLEGVYFPSKLNIEQTSSEVTARYKASLLSGTSLADITGGLGVDSFYFAKNFDVVDYFELNEKLAAIAKYNFQQLGVDNVNTSINDGLATILSKQYDTIYVDPARRHSAKGKVFFLKDCSPNIVGRASEILDHCNTLLIKTSPMLDISVGLDELKSVSKIHVVAVNNEVKELLWLLSKRAKGRVHINTVNITKNGVETKEFLLGEESTPTFGLPKQYLYEPNVAIMKAGVFMAIPEAFDVHKLHINSHLYTSDALKEFPGRRFRTNQIISYHKGDMKKCLAGTKANITTRNFSETVQQIRKKWRIKDGGDIYLFFTMNMDSQKIVLICSKIDVELLKD